MSYKNIADMHTHSEMSFDGNHSCDMLCESAIDKGLKAIAITDHCDIDGDMLDANEFCKKQYATVEKAKAKYSDTLQVITGLEIGQGIYRKELTREILNEYKYDFILGSLHNLENMEDFYFIDYKKYDVDKLLTDYFNDLLKLCEWGLFDSLAHLTYPLRYIAAREKINVDMSRYTQIIDAIFESLVKNNKALEINTSGLFMDMNDTMPNIEFVKRFRQAGGRYVTIGSDSHFADKIGQGIDIGMKIAYDSGFDKFTIFKKREPVLISIE